ncbi:hypothetical protein Q604_UNBC07757G0002 [human gut metagenome]|uniref:Uncharacterized protein n=1 Tax=human gut metagenome TaxID=408170 RepID=W1Y6C2_9ZZZZ
MVLAYQLLFIILVIGSSFFGLKAFMTIVMLSLLFTITNVYTLPLLLLQSSVILSAGAIGLIIAIFVSLSKAKDSWDYYKSRVSLDDIKSGLIFIALVIVELYIYKRVHAYTFYMYNGALYSVLKIALILANIYFVIVVPTKITEKFKLDSGGYGCIFVGILMIIIMRYIV